MNDKYSLKYQTNKLCVIISREQDRDGGEYDRMRLEELFENLLFQVDSIIDPKKDEFYRNLNKIKQKCENGDIGLLVVFFLCHGKEEEVILYDNELTDIKIILSYFAVESLKKIPKFFFFQACRGGNFANGYFTDVTCNEEHSVEAREATDIELNISKLPIDANTLVSCSSISGCKSFRTLWGSYFIYLIYQVFIAHSVKWDVVTMLTLVHRLIATKLMYEDCYGKKIMQMPSFKSKLTKKVFLTNKELSLQCGPFCNVDAKTALYYKNDERRLYNLACRLKLTKNDLMCEVDIADHIKDHPGLCLIFEKTMNTKTMIERTGSNADVDNFNKLFSTTLGWKVKKFQNLNKNQILTTLTKEMAKKELMSKITNFIVIVLTHGDNEEVCQDDEPKRDQKSLVDDFVLEMKKCDEIRKIPKIVLIQVDNLDLNQILENRNEGDDNRIFRHVEHDGHHLPSEANMLYMYSNVPARSDEGTPLVKHFCNTVSEGHLNNDLQSMLTVVNRKISEEIMDANFEILASNMPFFVSQLIDKVFFGRNKFQE